MNRRLVQVTDSVFLFRDTCNVYAITQGKRCILIDFGSGKVLPVLAETGIERVEGILHTHHHRDQAQGDGVAAEAGIPIYVPRFERHLFDQAEVYWATKQIYDMVNVRNTYFGLGESVHIRGVLDDFSSVTWGNLTFEVLPTPGHTVGSISVFVEIDGCPIAFVGDLLHSPGKVVTLFDLQHGYASLDGVEASVLSLDLIRNRRSDILCPSHGDPMMDAQAAITETANKLRSYYRLISGGEKPADEIDFERINSRLLFAPKANSSFYVILSGDGKRALFVDYGAVNDQLFSPSCLFSESGDTVRFFPHSLRRLEAQYGVEKIEAVMLTHCHDDHVCGVPYLVKEWATEVWALDTMTEMLENPADELTGCVLPFPIDVSRILTDGERFSWEGLDFEVRHTPGHCEYHMSIFTRIEDTEIAFTGDVVWPPDFVPNVIYRNHIRRDSYVKTAKLFQERKPELLCTGHGLYRDVAPESYESLYENAVKLARQFESLTPAGSCNRGIEPSWIRISPYQIPVKAGAGTAIQVIIENPLEITATVKYEWMLPSGWSVTPPRREATMGIGEKVTHEATLSLPADFAGPYPKRLVTLDIQLNEEYLGQITEAVAELSPYGPAGALPVKGLRSI